MVPDPATLERIKKLSVVGKFLNQISNSTSDTEFFSAKTSLELYRKDLNQLDLDPETKTGMNNLLDYLDRKIEKRRMQEITA